MKTKIISITSIIVILTFVIFFVGCGSKNIKVSRYTISTANTTNVKKTKIKIPKIKSFAASPISIADIQEIERSISLLQQAKDAVDSGNKSPADTLPLILDLATKLGNQTKNYAVLLNINALDIISANRQAEILKETLNVAVRALEKSEIDRDNLESLTLEVKRHFNLLADMCETKGNSEEFNKLVNSGFALAVAIVSLVQ